MTPTQTLREEHNIVLAVLDSMEQEYVNIKKGTLPNIDKIRKFIDFSHNFTDGCHHAKEEHKLFPYLGQKGFSMEDGPVAVMLMEHVEGRNFIKQTETALNSIEAGDDSLKTQLANALIGYVTLLREHIFKENNILFVMAERALSNEDEVKLSEQFEEAEKELGEGIHEKYHQIAHEIINL